VEAGRAKAKNRTAKERYRRIDMITLRIARCPRAKDPGAQRAKSLFRDCGVKGQV